MPNAILIKLLRNFIEVALWHRCSPVNLLHIFRTPFPGNTRRVRYIPLEIFSRICQKTPPNQRKLIHVQSDPLEN